MMIYFCSDKRNSSSCFLYKTKSIIYTSQCIILRNILFTISLIILLFIQCKNDVGMNIIHFDKSLSTPQYDSLISKGEDIVLNNNDLLTYNGISYEMYNVTWGHKTYQDFVSFAWNAVKISESLKKQNKKPFVIIEYTLPTPFYDFDEIIRTIKYNNNEFTFNRKLYNKLKNYFIDRTIDINQMMNAGKTESDKIKLIDLKSCIITELLRKYNIPFSIEHMAPESRLLHHYADSYLLENIVNSLAGGNPRVFYYFSLRKTSRMYAVLRRNRDILQQGARLASLGYVPIIILGSGHNLPKTKGSDNIIIHTIGEYTDNMLYSEIDMTELIQTVFKTRSLKYVMDNENDLKQYLLIVDLVKLITRDHIIKLQNRYSRIQLNKLVKGKGMKQVMSRDFYKIMAKWLIQDVDPQKISKIWKHYDLMIE